METYLQSRITDALLKVGVEQDNLPEIKIETPRVASHGDAATNIAMTLASVLRKNPRQIAQDIIDNLELDSQKITAAAVMAPGNASNFLISAFSVSCCSKFSSSFAGICQASLLTSFTLRRID